MTQIDCHKYFDFAATGIPDAEIIRSSIEQSLEHWGNPSSIHDWGKDAKNVLENAREICEKVLNVKKGTVYFTSGGTESDHIPLLAVINRPVKGSVAISNIEHPALREMKSSLEHAGLKVVSIQSDKNGFVTKENVLAALREDTVFVSVMAVNNETGAVNDIYSIADAITEFGKGKRKPFFHVDCVQAAGKVPLKLNHPGIDSAALSAHKIGGPRGIGILYLSKEINAFMRGGGQEKNVRSGTENVFGAVAFSKCLEKYFWNQERFELQKKWTEEFIQKLISQTNGKCTIIPHGRIELQDNYSPWVVQAAFKNIPGQVMVRALSSKGFYISTGSACSASKQSRPILDAMNISGAEKETAVRFSFGHLTTWDDMENLLKAVKETCEIFK